MPETGKSSPPRPTCASTPAATAAPVPTMYRELDEPAPVVLRDHGHELPAWLLAWRRDAGGWRAYVTWSTGVGLNHLGWFAAGDVRAA